MIKVGNCARAAIEQAAQGERRETSESAERDRGTKQQEGSNRAAREQQGKGKSGERAEAELSHELASLARAASPR